MKDDKNIVRAVCSAFVEKNGKILFVHDPKFRLWRVPGGKLEENEKVEGCITRELKEETGLNVENPKFIGFGQDRHTIYLDSGAKEVDRLIMYFLVETKGEINPDPDEISEYKWLTLEETKKHPNKEGALEDLFKRNPGLEP